jgi:hypothetical protein
LSCVGKVENLAARPRDQDLESDRPGRSFNSVSGQRSAMDGDRSARRIAEEIDRGRNAHG